MIAAMVANAAGAKPPFVPSDFFPSLEEEADDDVLWEKLRSIAVPATPAKG